MRRRAAHDVGFGGGTGSAGFISPAWSTTAAEEDLLLSSVAGVSSDALDCDETTESLCAFRTAAGLGGMMGTAGTTGSTGRAFGCVGVCCDFGAGIGGAEEGVLGCVDGALEGASEVSGVGVCVSE